MTTFAARHVSEAVLPVPRARIWDVVSDPSALADLTPLIASIEAQGDRWCWRLRSISALGVSIEPSFTEEMTFDAPSGITYRPAPPPGAEERLGATGSYRLDAVDDSTTRLYVDITLEVDLPLPRASRRAVEGVMRRTMRATGERFAENLYDRLGIDPSAVEVRELEPAA